MKFLLFLSIFSTLNVSLACRCVYRSLEEISKNSKFILQVKVLASENNISVVEVSRILKATNQEEYAHINRVLELNPIFAIYGVDNRGTSCPSTNVEKEIGAELLIIPNLNQESVPYTLVPKLTIGACSFANFLDIQSPSAQEIIKHI